MNEYSFWADVLSKFHTSPEWIQALWLLVVPLLLFGLGWCIKDVLTSFIRRTQEEKGELIYSIRRNHDNEMLVYQHGEAVGENTPILLAASNKQIEEKPN